MRRMRLHGLDGYSHFHNAVLVSLAIWNSSHSHPGGHSTIPGTKDISMLIFRVDECKSYMQFTPGIF